MKTKREDVRNVAIIAHVDHGSTVQPVIHFSLFAFRF